MVFKARGVKTYKMRVTAPDGRYATLSTGCRDEGDAREVEAVVRRWEGSQGKKHARPDVVELLVAKALTLADAYEWSLDGTLDQQVAALTALAGDTDLHPVVERWHAAKASAPKGAGQAGVYRRQLRALFPADEPFTLSMFRKGEAKRRLDALTVSAGTKSRHRTAVMQFAKFLVAEEILETNFVRDVPGYGENPERVVYYEREDAQRLVAGLPRENAAIAAFACGFAMECKALENLLVGDVRLDEDPVVARARGTKRGWRNRVVPLVPENAWVLPYIRAVLAGRLPTARVFPGFTEKRALKLQQRVARELEIRAVGEEEFGQHTLHDWRHTHAVQLLRDGYTEQIAAAHLGHKNTDLVRKRYGVFKPTAHDYARARQVEQERRARAQNTTNLTTTDPGRSARRRQRDG